MASNYWSKTLFKLKSDLARGILIGMGVMIIVLGSFGWFVADYLRHTLGNILVDYVYASNLYIFRELNHLRFVYISCIVIGIVSLSIGITLNRLPFNEA